MPFRQATIDGMFVPAGSGDVDLAGIIRHLEGRGYQGWYVLEQDCSLTGDPAPGTGPHRGTPRQASEFLKKVARDVVNPDVRVLGSHVAKLGESPLWSGRDSTLYWVDVDGCSIQALSWASSEPATWALPGRPSCIAMTEHDSSFIVGMGRGHHRVQPGFRRVGGASRAGERSACSHERWPHRPPLADCGSARWMREPTTSQIFHAGTSSE